MQKFIMLGVMAAAIVGLTTALAGNEIQLTVQNLGVGEREINTQVKNASVDFVLDKQNIGAIGQPGTFWKNVITHCSFHSLQEISENSVIVCKLLGPTQETLNAIYEGKLTVTNQVPTTGPGYDNVKRVLKASNTILIPLDQFAIDNSADVQKVKGVKIIVLGPLPHGMPAP